MHQRSELQRALRTEPFLSLMWAISATASPTIALLAEEMGFSREEVGKRVRSLREMLFANPSSRDAFLEETRDKLVRLFLEAIPESGEEMAKEMAAAGVDVKVAAERVRQGVAAALSAFLHNLRRALVESHHDGAINILDAVERGANTLPEIAEAMGTRDISAIREDLNFIRVQAMLTSRRPSSEGEDLIEDAPIIYGRLTRLFDEVTPKEDTPGQAFANLIKFEEMWWRER